VSQEIWCVVVIASVAALSMIASAVAWSLLG